MKLTKSDTNNAIITSLANVRKHSNADRLKLATVLGTQVIVGLDAKDGDLVVYFDSNLRLSYEYLYYNNLYSNKEMNSDPTQKGYFGKNGRVKAQRFRGEISNGYVADFSSLDAVKGIVDNNQRVYPSFYLKKGDEFTHINGVEICSKYIVPVKHYSMQGKAKIHPVVSDMFWKHWDTKQLMREKDRIVPGPLYVEEKIHGTSGRTGKVLCYTGKKWYQFWKPITEWKVISGTRRVDDIKFHMYSERHLIEEKIAPHLHKGEEVYYEIFGHKATGGEIQTRYSYGCTGGEYKVMLYRVTITTPDGYSIDLNREQVYKRAEELGLEKPVLLTTRFMFEDSNIDDICEQIMDFAKGRSTLDANTLREGVVVWFKNCNGNWSCLKYKGEEFLLDESKQKDKEVGDVEDEL